MATRMTSSTRAPVCLALLSALAPAGCARGGDAPVPPPGSSPSYDAAASSRRDTREARVPDAGASDAEALTETETELPPVTPASKVPIHPAVADLVARRKPSDTPADRRTQLFEVLEGVSKIHTQKREEVILNAIDQGLQDEPSWVVVESHYEGHDARIRVSTDALKINGVRVSLSAIGAQHVADRLGTILPTARILDLVWQNATAKFPPCTLPPDKDMVSTRRMFEHSSCVDARLAGRTGLAANVGKNWVVTNALDADTDRAANYGWFRSGKRPIQTVGTHHDKGYTDYSQIVRLVDPTITVDGHKMDIREVAQSHELWGLVSDEGPLRLWRMALKGASKAERIEPAPPEPLPTFPKAKRPIVKLTASGLPFALEQLPETLLGLRQQRIARAVAGVYDVEEADLPEEALWSAHATTCGGHDVFFEVVTGAAPPRPRLEAEREALRTAMSCGRDAVKAQQPRSLYEVDYLFAGAPASFGVLRAPPGAPAIPAAYPLLPAAPAGAKAAACRDGDAAGGHACHHGARSRLVVEVEGGTLGTHAREAAFLLERLGRTAEPNPEAKAILGLFERLRSNDVVRVERGEACAAAWDAALVVSPTAATSRTELFHTLMEHARICAVGRTGSSHDGRVELTYAPKGDGGAKEIEAALRRRLAAMRLEEPSPDTKSTVEADYRLARRDILRRAIADAKVEQKDGLVTLAFTLSPGSDAEKKSIARYLALKKSSFGSAAELVRAAIEGRPLPTSPR